MMCSSQFLIKSLKVFSALFVFFIAACSSQQAVIPAVTTQAEIKPDIVDPLVQTTKKIDDRLFVEGISALELNELDKAKKLFKEFINKNPQLSGAYVNLALIHFKQNSLKQALNYTDKALSLNPSHAQAYQLRAQLNIKNGKINDAKKDYIKAIQINPEYINAQYNLALLYDIYLQDINSAIKHYEIYMSLINTEDEPTKEWINHLKGTLKNG